MRSAEKVVLAEGVFVPALKLDGEPRCDSLFVVDLVLRQLDVGACVNSYMRGTSQLHVARCDGLFVVDLVLRQLEVGA